MTASSNSKTVIASVRATVLLSLACWGIGVLYSYIRDPESWENLIRFRPFEHEQEKALTHLDAVEKKSMLLTGLQTQVNTHLEKIHMIVPPTDAHPFDANAKWRSNVFLTVKNLTPTSRLDYSNSYSLLEFGPITINKQTGRASILQVRTMSVPTALELSPNNSNQSPTVNTETISLEFVSKLFPNLITTGEPSDNDPKKEKKEVKELDEREFNALASQAIATSLSNCLQLKKDIDKWQGDVTTEKKVFVTRLASSNGILWAMIGQRILFTIFLISVIWYLMSSAKWDFVMSRAIECITSGKPDRNFDADELQRFIEVLSGQSHFTKGSHSKKPNGGVNVADAATKVVETVASVATGGQ